MCCVCAFAIYVQLIVRCFRLFWWLMKVFMYFRKIHFDLLACICFNLTWHLSGVWARCKTISSVSLNPNWQSTTSPPFNCSGTGPWEIPIVLFAKRKKMQLQTHSHIHWRSLQANAQAHAHKHTTRISHERSHTSTNVHTHVLMIISRNNTNAHTQNYCHMHQT